MKSPRQALEEAPKALLRPLPRIVWMPVILQKTDGAIARTERRVFVVQLFLEGFRKLLVEGNRIAALLADGEHGFNWKKAIAGVAEHGPDESAEVGFCGFGLRDFEVGLY